MALTKFQLLSILALSTLIAFNSLDANGEKLPTGTTTSIIYPSSADEFHTVVFTEQNSKVASFPNPGTPIKKLIATVTTGVNSAELFFTTDGIEYSYPILPNSNTALIFDKIIDVSSVYITIDGRTYADNAASVGYDDGISLLPYDELPIGDLIGHSLCIASGGKCDPMAKEILKELGFTVMSRDDMPSDMNRYDVVILTGLDPTKPDEQMQILKNYVENGGGIVFLAGVAYNIPYEHRGWLGYSGTGWTGGGETAEISIDAPFESMLSKGSILKIQANYERGAQTISDVIGNVVAQYGDGSPYAYYKEYEAGRIFYQADNTPSLSNVVGLNNIKQLMKAGIEWASKVKKNHEEPEHEEKDNKNTQMSSIQKTKPNDIEDSNSKRLQSTIIEDEIQVPQKYPAKPKLTLSIADLEVKPEVTLNHKMLFEGKELSNIIWGLPMIPIISYYLSKRKKKILIHSN